MSEDNRPPPSLEDEACAAERVRECLAIIEQGAAKLAAAAVRPSAPRRRHEEGEEWICYRCPRPHLTTDPNHRPNWPAAPTLNGLPAGSLDNWPAAANRAALRRFEAYVDELLDRQEGDQDDWQEAAE